jgi:hypothetical protein
METEADYNGFVTFLFLKYKISPPSWGFDVPLATALSKTILLRMLNDS